MRSNVAQLTSVQYIVWMINLTTILGSWAGEECQKKPDAI